MFEECTEREQALIVWVGFAWISFRRRSCVGFKVTFTLFRWQKQTLSGEVISRASFASNKFQLPGNKAGSNYLYSKVK